MYRFAIEDMKAWKESAKRKPLIIQGARQVGKTWLMKEFASQCYENMVYLNFDSDKRLAALFESDLNPDKIISSIELLFDTKVDQQKTLIIFDEVQEAPRALTSLKYFCEQAPEYNIVCAGSLLGIALHEKTSFPVGKVEFLRLNPLSYSEFLLALGEKKMLDLLQTKDWQSIKILKDSYVQHLKEYYLVGGMPEVISAFISNKSFEEARKIQSNILKAYEQDFSKHAPNNIVPKIRAVWNNVPAQLAKENKKFLYGLIREGARAKEFESAIMWLCDCGLLHKVSRVSAIKKPLKSYIDLKAFRLFFVDVGLLAALSDVEPQAIFEGDALFSEFKGTLTEQYVCQQLCTNALFDVFYYTNTKNTCELDFVLSAKGKVLPIEVKAETNLKAKSLKVTKEKFNFAHAYRFSMADFKKDNWITNVPLYGIEYFNQQHK